MSQNPLVLKYHLTLRDESKQQLSLYRSPKLHIFKSRSNMTQPSSAYQLIASHARDVQVSHTPAHQGIAQNSARLSQ